MGEKNTTLARVTALHYLTDDILQLQLRPDHYIDYQAGQYLQLLLPHSQLSFSIANAPSKNGEYTLHFRVKAHNPDHQYLLTMIKQQEPIHLKLPLGDCHLGHLILHQPILFIAGGTGIAPIKAMLEQLLVQKDPRALQLFWGAHAQQDLYMDEEIKTWQKKSNNFNYFPQLHSASQKELITSVLRHHPEDLAQWQVVLSGPFDLVYQLRDALLAQGAKREQLFSDAFAFENNT